MRRTASHISLDEKRGKVKTTPTLAQDLKEGDELWGYEDAPIVTRIEQNALPAPVKVYNFEVKANEGNNNYFAGEHLILVHNCNMGEGVSAVSNASGKACLISTGLCAGGLASTVINGVAVIPSGGTAVVTLPEVGSLTVGVCNTALVTCTTAVVTDGLQNVLSTGTGDGGGGDSGGVNTEAEATPQKQGRTGRQQRLRDIAEDGKAASSDRGWINQEINSIERGQRKNIRNPPGKELAHERGREASKGYDYEHSNLQDKDLHKLQHKYDNFGRKNKERPVTQDNP